MVVTYHQSQTMVHQPTDYVHSTGSVMLTKAQPHFNDDALHAKLNRTLR